MTPYEDVRHSKFEGLEGNMTSTLLLQRKGSEFRSINKNILRDERGLGNASSIAYQIKQDKIKSTGRDISPNEKRKDSQRTRFQGEVRRGGVNRRNLG